MPKTLAIYYNTSRKEFPLDEAMAEVKRHKSFNVFLQFIDPRTDCLVQKSFVFFPKPFLKPWKNVPSTAEHRPGRSPNSAESGSRAGVSPARPGESTLIALPRSGAREVLSALPTGRALHAPL